MLGILKRARGSVAIALQTASVWAPDRNKELGTFGAGHLETVRLLHSSGANLKLVDAAKGRNALEWAAFNNHREACPIHSVLPVLTKLFLILVHEADLDWQ